MDDDDFQPIISQQDYKKLKQFEQNYQIAVKEKQTLEIQINNLQNKCLDLEAEIKVKNKKNELKNLQTYKKQFQIALLLDLIGRIKSDMNVDSGMKVMRSSVSDSFNILKESTIQQNQNKLPEWVNFHQQQRKIFQKYQNQCDLVEQMAKQFSGKTALVQNYQKELIELKKAKNKQENIDDKKNDYNLKIDSLQKQNIQLKDKLANIQKDKSQLAKILEQNKNKIVSNANSQSEQTKKLIKQIENLENCVKVYKQSEIKNKQNVVNLKNQLEYLKLQLRQAKSKEQKDKKQNCNGQKSELNLTVRDKIICLLEQYKMDLDKNIKQLQLNQGDSKLMTMAQLDQMRKDIIKILGPSK